MKQATDLASQTTMADVTQVAGYSSLGKISNPLYPAVELYAGLKISIPRDIGKM